MNINNGKNAFGERAAMSIDEQRKGSNTSSNKKLVVRCIRRFADYPYLPLAGRFTVVLCLGESQSEQRCSSSGTSVVDYIHTYLHRNLKFARRLYSQSTRFAVFFKSRYV
ncbi:hypothetical protein BofuT4_P076230.1 [Botrytis cinerea T4]|uniref:Uncharacterized protein n=1 Tax=Botryotinia fuckeliana (strain T4) TaxID=999810 RepID=G2XNT4_BOTF4|nr:hypothetical protein BofuT4_P076230.1 [Botrytis cinerea T4]